MLSVISFSNLWHLLIIMSLRILKMFDQKNILHDPTTEYFSIIFIQKQ